MGGMCMLGVRSFRSCTHNGVNLAHLRRGIRADVLDKLGLDVAKILTLKNAAGGSTWSCGVTASSASARKQSVNKPFILGLDHDAHNFTLSHKTGFFPRAWKRRGMMLTFLKLSIGCPGGEMIMVGCNARVRSRMAGCVWRDR
jgi:hypothetical protein